MDVDGPCVLGCSLVVDAPLLVEKTKKGSDARITAIVACVYGFAVALI